MRASPVGKPGWSLSGEGGDWESGRDVRSTQLSHTLKFCQRRKQGNGPHLEREVGGGQGRVFFFLDMGEITANLYDGMSDPRGRRSLMAQQGRGR